MQNSLLVGAVFDECACLHVHAGLPLQKSELSSKLNKMIANVKRSSGHSCMLVPELRVTVAVAADRRDGGVSGRLPAAQQAVAITPVCCSQPPIYSPIPDEH